MTYVIQSLLIIILISILRFYVELFMMQGFGITFKAFGNRLAFAKLLTSLIFWGISTAYYFSLHYLKHKEVMHQVERDKLRLEIDFQQSRVNPHFLFNTLGNIHALAIQKSDRTGDAIMDLSDLMRYMLYEGRAEKVRLSKELEFIEHFINLQKLRLSDSVRINFRSNIEEDVLIEPLMFISFVENAFKHGNLDDGTIKIELNGNAKVIIFKCENQKTAQILVEEQSGFGIENIKKRLDLLYPNQHNLKITDHAKIFSVQLTLELTS